MVQRTQHKHALKGCSHYVSKAFAANGRSREAGIRIAGKQ